MLFPPSENDLVQIDIPHDCVGKWCALPKVRSATFHWLEKNSGLIYFAWLLRGGYYSILEFNFNAGPLDLFGHSGTTSLCTPSSCAFQSGLCGNTSICTTELLYPSNWLPLWCLISLCGPKFRKDQAFQINLILIDWLIDFTVDQRTKDKGQRIFILGLSTLWISAPKQVTTHLTF